MKLQWSRSVVAFALAMSALACNSAREPVLQAPDSLVPSSELRGVAPGRADRSVLEVYGRDIAAGWANVSVLQAGLPVDDAAVTVNGEPIPRPIGTSYDEPGLYSGPIRPVLSAGQNVFLEVTRGGLTVKGKGKIPDSPTLTSPATGAKYVPTADVAVTWASPTDPDYFVVAATWSCGTGCGTGKRFEAAGTARALTIAAGSLPTGQEVSLRVFAYDDGRFHRDYAPHAPYPGMNIRAESSPATVLIADRPKLTVWGQDMGAMHQNVHVLRDGVAVTDATVLVNGRPLTHQSSGWYYGALPAAVPVGGTLSLQVTSGGSGVTAIGNVPESPVMTTPTTGSNFATTADVPVTWTSATNPDRFDVWATWSCGPSCGTGKRFEAAGSARSFTIPAGSLPVGQDVVLRVFAYDDGTFSGDYAPYAPYPGMNIRAESNQATVTVADHPKLTVWGQDMGAMHQNVHVMRDGLAVTDATVLVNGQPLTHQSAGWYYGALSAAVPAGGTLSLDVTSGVSRVTAVGSVPEAPVMTAPTAGTIFAPSQDVPVTWTSSTSPDYFSVEAQWSCGPVCGTGKRFVVPATARSFTIPATELPSGQIVDVSVFAYDDGAFSGDYAPPAWYPGMNIRAESFRVSVSH